MRYGLLLVMLAIGCAGPAPVVDEAAELKERARILARTTLAPHPTKESPYQVRFSELPKTGTPAWWGDRREPIIKDLVEDDQLTLDPPIGIDPRRPVKVVLKLDETRRRVFTVRFPVGPTNWPANAPLRTRNGVLSASALKRSATDSFSFVIDGPAPATGVRRALTYEVQGRFDPRPLVPKSREFRLVQGETSVGFDIGLFRSGDRVRIVGELVEGPTEDRTVRLAIPPPATQGEPWIGMRTKELARFSDIDVQVGLGDIPREYTLGTMVTMTMSREIPALLFTRVPKTKDFYLAHDTPDTPRYGRAAHATFYPDRRPTEAVADLRLMRITKRVPFDFLLKVP